MAFLSAAHRKVLQHTGKNLASLDWLVRVEVSSESVPEAQRKKRRLYPYGARGVKSKWRQAAALQRACLREAETYG
jgi:hypothetical protein